MEEVDFIWFNGEMKKWAECNTHVLTHSLHYGMGVFEGIRAYETDKGTAIFRLRDHTERLFKSAEIVGMETTFDVETFITATKEVIKQNNLKSGYIRPIFYHGYGKMGLDTNGAKIDAIIAAWPWGAYLGEDGKKNGISLKISKYTRHFPVKNLNQSKATGFYINSTMAKMDALNTGFNEAVMLDLQGNVAECSGENIFIVKNKVLITPSPQNCLNGITRKSILEIANDEGIKTEEKIISQNDLMDADEVFLTGTAAELTPVNKINEKPFGVGEITQLLQKKYEDIIHGRNEKYFKWLDFVE
jgi:branched-chain amino acid aminotransferase